MSLPPDLLAAVAALSPEDLRELAGRVRVLQSLDRAPGHVSAVAETTSPAAHMLFEAVADVLAASLGARPHLGPAVGIEINKRALPLGPFLAAQSPDRLVRAAIARHGVALLADHMRGWGVPVSASTLARNIDKLPAVLDAHYPGYGAAGLLARAVTRGPRRPHDGADPLVVDGG